jgi:hypothetical protein
MADTNLQAAAPGATPGATTPAKPAVAATPAPVAAAAEPATLNDYAELARKSLTGELPASPALEPADSGPEPSPEPTAPEPAEPASTEPPATGDEPTADEMANWTDGEKRLHGALQKERTESKEARAAVRELKTKLAELESKLTNRPASQAAPETPAAQPPPVATTGEMLADCHTFEAIDARVQQAATYKAEAARLQNVLNRNGTEPVVERLLAKGVTAINGVPVAEASPDQIGDFLATVYEGAELTQAQAEPRKQWLVQNQHNLVEAVKRVPELNDANSEAFKAAQRIMAANPALRQRADWPVVIAKLYLGERIFNTQPTPAAPAATAKPAVKPAAKPAPSAPKVSVAALPNPPANEALAAKLANGTASLAEVQAYTRGHIAAA